MKIKIKNIDFSYANIIIFLLAIVCLSGSSVLENARIPALIFLNIVILLNFIKKKTKFSKEFLLWLIWLLAIICVSVFSFDMATTWYYIFIYFSGIVLLNYKFTVENIEKICKIFKIVCTIIASSIILAFFFPELMNTLWFTLSVYRQSALQRIYTEQTLIKAFSGLAGERSEAAFLMNIGIAIIMSERVCKKDKKNKLQESIYLFLMFFALVLTGKRTLLIIAVLIFLLAFLINGKANEKIKLLVVACVIAIALVILADYVPIIQHTIDRFHISDNSDITNGRSNLWKYAIDMFFERPFIGGGLGAFNEYTFQNGYSVNYPWKYHCHNIYIQAFGEMGSIIFTLWVCLLIKSLLDSWRCFVRNADEEKRKIVIMTFFIQLVILIYGLTGNTLYYDNQNIMYFLSLSLLYSIKGKKENERK